MRKILFNRFKKIIKHNNFMDLVSKNGLFESKEFTKPLQVMKLLGRDADYDNREEIGDINLDKVIGVCNTKFESNSWEDYSWSNIFYFDMLTRMNMNLILLKDNIDFYYGDSNIGVGMEFISEDNGETFFINNGNHRTFIAKFLFALERIYTGKTENILRNVHLIFIKPL